MGPPRKHPGTSNDCPSEGWETGAFIHHQLLAHRFRVVPGGINCSAFPDCSCGQAKWAPVGVKRPSDRGACAPGKLSTAAAAESTSRPRDVAQRASGFYYRVISKCTCNGSGALNGSPELRGKCPAFLIELIRPSANWPASAATSFVMTPYSEFAVCAVHGSHPHDFASAVLSACKSLPMCILFLDQLILQDFFNFFPDHPSQSQTPCPISIIAPTSSFIIFSSSELSPPQLHRQ